jgi:hypothetical protein
MASCSAVSRLHISGGGRSQERQVAGIYGERVKVAVTP